MTKISQKKVALLGTHGIPARHGAFEQTIAKLCEYARSMDIDAQFLVGCSMEGRSLAYEEPNVTRLFAPRHKGIGILLYDLLTSIKAYASGARTFVYFGYEFAPFFWFFQLLGVSIICNVDGIEWRRAKWGRLAKFYFRLCEYVVVRSADHLVFDAHGIARYFKINHQATGHLIFYGSDPIADSTMEIEFASGSYYSLVMRMEPENNIKVIIEGFQRAEVSKPLLLIGPSTPFFEEECLPLVDGEKVRYLGPIYDRERLNVIRRHCYAYLHGHSVGGTNPTLIEAIGLKNRIIAYNSIFNREVCGDNAVFFSSPDELATLLEQDDLPPPPTLSSAYTWDDVVKAYFEICALRERNF